MKKLFTILLAISFATGAFSQAPQKMSYQGVIRDAGGKLIKSQGIGMQISILKDSESGTAVYVERQNKTTNANGLASIMIGAGAAQSGDFAAIDWTDGLYFVKIETDPTEAGGTNYTIEAISQLLSVPYALYAANAGTATGGGNFTHYIGEEFGGGVIFHLWKDNIGVEHGLIVALTDQSTSHWSNNYTLIGDSAQSSWNGLSNSNAIVGQAGHTSSAAKLCLDLESGGKTDWYLPSIDELSLMWHNRFNVNKALSTIGGATVLPISVAYWSSTEANATSAWGFSFSNGSNFGASKGGSSGYVRGVRAF